MLKRSMLLALMILPILSACGKPGGKIEPAEAASNTDTIADLQLLRTQTEIDVTCVDTLVSENWHDDPILDASTILSEAQGRGGSISQAGIDVLIDVALLSDENCVTRSNQ